MNKSRPGCNPGGGSCSPGLFSCPSPPRNRTSPATASQPRRDTVPEPPEVHLHSGAQRAHKATQPGRGAGVQPHRWDAVRGAQSRHRGDLQSHRATHRARAKEYRKTLQSKYRATGTTQAKYLRLCLPFTRKKRLIFFVF